MKRIPLVWSLWLAMGLVPQVASGQERGAVNGQVVDGSTGRPLAAALVTVAGTSLGAITNQDGRYVIANVPAGSWELRAAILGYSGGSEAIQVSAGSTATVNFSLDRTALELQGVVATATGQSQRLREIGNNVASISTEDVEMAAVPSLTNLIQGRATGVVIQPTSGSLGSGARIRIRGNSSVSLSGTPLVIVDGIRVSNDVESTGLFTGGITTSRWNDINPDDIESIEILKGPSASTLYGTAAANGVVQITTKRGRGGRAQIRTYVEATRMKVPDDMVPTSYRARGFRSDLGTIGDCSLVERIAELCTEVDSLYTYSPLLQAENSPLRSGHQERLGVSVSGGAGDGSTTYFVSAETESGPGVLAPNRLDRTNLRANLSSAVNERLRIGANTNFVTSYIELAQEGNTGSGAWLNGSFGADPSPSNVERGGFNPPYSAETVGWWRNEEELRRFVGSFTVDWRPTHWLQINGVAGVDQVNRFETGTVPPPGLATGFMPTGLREQYRTQDRDLTSNLSAHATAPITETISSTTAVGVQYHETRSDFSYGAGSGLAPGTLTTSQALSVQEFFGETKLFGAYASEQVSFNDRLYLTAAIRGDQNSAFGDNIGFVVYPALSASWVIGEEPWFPSPDFLSGLRLRAAFGESGQRPGRLDAVRTYIAPAVAIGGEVTGGYVIDNAGNANLTAERSREIEFGFDAAFFDDRLAVDLTRYVKTTRDALVARPLAPSAGGPEFQYFNLGKVRNAGWEASLRYDVLQTDQVGANVGVSFSSNRNRLVAMGDTATVAFGLQRHEEGYPLGGYWATAYEYADENGDGLIQADEVKVRDQQDNEADGVSYMGQPFPTRELSFTGEVNVLGMFRLSGLLDYKGGHQIYNWGGRVRCAELTGSFCRERHVEGAASLEQQARIMARRTLGLPTGYIEDADFWKLRELALTFDVPAEWLARTRVGRSLSISLAGRNLKTWTDYSGLEPETNIPGSVTTDEDPGRFYTVDLFTVPTPRSFIVRLDVGL